MGAGQLRLQLRFCEHERVCDIIVQDRILERLGSQVATLFSSRKIIPSSILIVTDDNVAKIFGQKIKSKLTKVSPKTALFVVKAGEGSKTIETASELCNRLATAGADKNALLVALGGGVVGDLAGFVASIFKRGIEYIQVPTTLLAQVDSSIGGKTGVDSEWGKNQLGTFYQPMAVFIDPATLISLPKSETVNGAAEIAKSAIIASREMFDRFCAISDPKSLDDLKRFIPETCRIKADIVSKDEREENLRSILNFGHTIGHAIESSSGYALSHGRSIILGMLAEGWVAEELGIFAKDDCFRCEEMLRKFLPSIFTNMRTKRSSITIRRVLSNERSLARFALADKKSSALSGTIRMSLPRRIGKMAITKDGSYRIPVPKELFLESIRYLLSTLS